MTAGLKGQKVAALGDPGGGSVRDQIFDDQLGEPPFDGLAMGVIVRWMILRRRSEHEIISHASAGSLASLSQTTCQTVGPW